MNQLLYNGLGVVFGLGSWFHFFFLLLLLKSYEQDGWKRKSFVLNCYVTGSSLLGLRHDGGCVWVYYLMLRIVWIWEYRESYFYLIYHLGMWNAFDGSRSLVFVTQPWCETSS